MEIKEAIEQLSILQRWIKERHAWYEALNMAISALEKQVEKKPLTNEGRLNAMSVEEKADCLNDIWHHLVFGNDAPGPCGMCHEISISSCRACWLDWLKQEVKEDE